MSVSISSSNIKAFKKSYKKAVAEELTSFVFEGQEVLTTFAKYLIEHVKFKNVKR